MRKILILLTILTLTISVHSQTQNGLKEDLEYFAQNLPQKHINLFAKISKTEFESKISRVESQLNSLDKEAFLNELFKLLVAVGDEHTRVEPETMGSGNVPVQFSIFTEGVFITAIDSAHTELLLSKVMKVNGEPINKVIDELKTIIQPDNPSYFNTMMLYYLGNAPILKGMGISNSAEEVIYTLERESGEIIDISFKSGGSSKLVMAKQFPKADMYSNSYWYKYDAVNQSIYFNYLNCRNDGQLPFENFALELFKSIETNKPEKIIVDLRFNGGGSSYVLQPFLKKIKESYLNKKGSFYVLIGQGTFSSALMNAIDLKRDFNTILVGAPTAGSINHYGETLVFRLPNTNASVIYSTKYFETWKGKEGALYPDVKVKYSVENFKNGTDEALEYIHKQ